MQPNSGWRFRRRSDFGMHGRRFPGIVGDRHLPIRIRAASIPYQRERLYRPVHGTRAPALQLQNSNCTTQLRRRDVRRGCRSPYYPVVLGLEDSAHGLCRHAFGGKLMTRRKERGTQIVEFAVVLPIIMLLSLAVAEGANMFRVYQLVANASREGARLSSLPTYSWM